MILFAVSTQTDLGSLFIGGILPGFLIAGALVLYVWLYAKKNNLDIELSSEYISGVDLISTVGTVTNVDATINTQIEQGSTDEFIEIINTDEIGLN